MSVSRERKTVWAWAVVLLLAAQWVGAPVQFLAHRHVWCQDHGRFEHLHDHRHDLSNKPHSGDYARFRQPAGPGASVEPDDHSRPHEHDACQILAQLNQKTDRTSCEGLCGRIGQQPVPHAGVWIADLPSIPLLSLAPKRSPPEA